MNLRIGIITDAIEDGAAGIGTYVRNLVDNILRLDKKNEYFLIHNRKSNDIFYRKYASNKRVFEIIVPAYRIPFGRELRKIFTMPRVLKKYNFNVVHETAQIGPFFGKTPFKKIVTIHDLAPLICPRWHGFMTYLHHRFGLSLMLKNVDKVISDSNNTKKDLQRFFTVKNSKVKVIPLAAFPTSGRASKSIIDKVKARYGLDSYCLYVGSIEPRKNIERMVVAFNSIAGSKSLDFVIVTKKGWKNKKIFDRIRRSPYDNRIIILHNVSGRDLKALYSSAKFCFFISLYEGFGLPVLEAMTCGCPVVSSNAASIPEVTGSASIVVDPLDQKEINKAMLKIFDPKVRRDLIKRGFSNVKKYSWKRTAKEVISVYNDL